MESKETEKECLLCGEYLRLNLSGKLTDNKTGASKNVYFCEECEQSFVEHEDKIMLIPYRDDMTPIKHECKVCCKIENFDQNVVFIIGEGIQFDIYCQDCGLEFLRNWLRKTHPDKVNNITKDNLKEISQLHEIETVNKRFAKGRM
jgi:hypothetical protein